MAMTDCADACLSADEHRAVELAADLFNCICRDVIGSGPTRQADTAELALHVHAIQNMVLANAAARAFPSRYRTLGGVIPPEGLAAAESALVEVKA